MTQELKAEVKYALKGNLQAGDTITAVHVKEQAFGACPVYLETGHTYLVPLYRNGKDYSYSRFSLIISDLNDKFDGYIADIKNGLQQYAQTRSHTAAL